MLRSSIGVQLRVIRGQHPPGMHPTPTHCVIRCYSSSDVSGRFHHRSPKGPVVDAVAPRALPMTHIFATVCAYLPFVWHSSSATTALSGGTPQSLRHALWVPSPGRLYARDRGGGNTPNRKDKGDNEGGEGDAPDEDGGSMEEWLVPRTCLFVLLMFIVTVALYMMGRPRGRHTGWASLIAHAGEIECIELYDSYMQVYLISGDRVYLGLVDTAHTQAKMDVLADAYKAAIAKKTQAAAASTSAAAAPGEMAAKDIEKASKVDQPAELDVRMRGTPKSESILMGVGVFAWIVPFVFFPVFVMFLSQYIGRSMSIAVDATRGKTKAKDMVFRVESSSSTRFRDIAGMKEPKREITEIVDFLRHPERYTKLGAKIPTGALLLGPPGTGKTLLAKAVAGESGVGFIPVCGSDFVELYVGMGALRVRQLFKEARKQRCIVYIDEIDAIGLKRSGAGHGEKQEQEQTLNELLTQLDGFSTGERGEVMVLASSNVSQEALDPALIRAGRFDRLIHVDTPVISERIDIFKVHLSKLKLVSDEQKGRADLQKAKEMEQSTTPAAEGEGKAGAATVRPVSTEERRDVNTTETRLTLSAIEEERQHEEQIRAAEAADGRASFDFRSLLAAKSDVERALIEVYAARMSNLCPGFVGADIANVCNEGAILAAREGAPHVDIRHLERSIDRVIAGVEHRSRAMSPFETNVVAHHEAGHAVAGWFLNRADPLMKVSIVPRGGSALGYAQYLPNENHTRTAKEIRDSISVTLGGRVAEKIFFDHLSTGASDDLRKVGKMAYMYVSSFAPGSVYAAPGTSATRYQKPFGAQKSDDFDVKAKALVDEIYEETVQLLTKHKREMELLAQHLLKHEMLTYQDVVNYLGERKGREEDRRKGV